MWSDRDLYEYDPPSDSCYDCGSPDTCGGSGRELLCSACIDDRGSRGNWPFSSPPAEEEGNE